MKYFDFELLGIKRKLPFVKVAGRLALASFVVISDTELVKAAAPELVKRLPEVDLLLTAEAKGIILAYEMSRIMGMENFVVARKSYKPYMQNALSHTLRSVTTQKEQTLWLDFATGESLAAVEALATAAGAKVVARAAILAELESVGRPDLIYLKEHYVFRAEDDGTFTPIKTLKEMEEAKNAQ